MNYYVSAIDGSRRYLVAGPYETHKAAAGAVPLARALGEKSDPFSHFFAWGTAGSDAVINTPLGAGWQGFDVRQTAE